MVEFLDWAILIIVIAVMFILGIIPYARAKTYDQFLVAERKIGYFQTICVSVGLCLAGYIGVVGLAYIFGLSGSWFFIMLALGFLICSVTIFTRLRRLERYNITDVYNERYGRTSMFVAAVPTLFSYAAILSIGFVGSGLVISAMTGLDLRITTTIMGILFTMKVVVGGWPGTSYTTTFQTLIGLPVVFGIAFFAIQQVGGWEGLMMKLPPENVTFFSPLTLIFIWAFFWSMTLSMPSTADAYQIINSAKSIKVVKNSYVVAGIIVILIGIAAAIIGTAGAVAFPGFKTEMEAEASLVMFSALLPAGLLGLAMAGVLAGASSLVDIDLMVGATLLARLLPREISTKMLRIFAAIFGIVALSIALIYGPWVLGLVLLCFRVFIPATVPAVIGSFYWERATTAGAIASTVVGALTGLLLTIFFVPAYPELEFVLEPAFVGTAVSTLVFIIVSLLTRHSFVEKPKEFLVKVKG
jgi:SSS family solute:Na+ symporter